MQAQSSFFIESRKFRIEFQHNCVVQYGQSNFILCVRLCRYERGQYLYFVVVKVMVENFELTNEQRRYFGLNPIESTWDRIQWLDTSYIFFDGNIIRKIIHYDPHPNFHRGYIERDYDLQTENREFIKPKTIKGKLKKLTSSNILTFKPINVSFAWQHRGVQVKCEANSIIIAKMSDREFDTFEKLESWIDGYTTSVSKNHFEQLEAIKQMTKPKKNNTYKQGDIFSYQMDYNKFYFGQIMLDLRKVLTCGKFPEEKILVQLGRFGMFGNPLIVRGFEFCSDSSKPDLDRLLQSQSTGCFYSIDYMIYNNICPIIGSYNIKEKDLLFPMTLWVDSEESEIIFQWGFIEKQLDYTILKPLIEKFDYELRHVGNTKYYSAIITPKISGYYMPTDLYHPNNNDLKKEVFKIMGISQDITYNNFAKNEGELIVDEIFERFN